MVEGKYTKVRNESFAPLTLLVRGTRRKTVCTAQLQPNLAQLAVAASRMTWRRTEPREVDAEILGFCGGEWRGRRADHVRVQAFYARCPVVCPLIYPSLHAKRVDKSHRSLDECLVDSWC